MIYSRIKFCWSIIQKLAPPCIFQPGVKGGEVCTTQVDGKETCETVDKWGTITMTRQIRFYMKYRLGDGKLYSRRTRCLPQLWWKLLHNLHRASMKCFICTRNRKNIEVNVNVNDVLTKQQDKICLSSMFHVFPSFRG